jgi:2-isopropylmalate synthase
MNGVLYGPATQIEATMNGVGERAGNAAIEQVVAQIIHLKTTGEGNLPLLTTNIDASLIAEVSRFISDKMHTNAVQKDESVYTPVAPENFGMKTRLFFGPLSGGNHAQGVVRDAGYICSDDEKAALAQFTKDLYADRRKGITDDELVNAYKEFKSPIKVESFSYSSSSDGTRATIKGSFFNATEVTFSGKTLLQGLMTEIKKSMPDIEVRDFKENSVGVTVESLAHSEFTLASSDGVAITASAENEDTQMAAVQALIKAVNLLWVEKNCRQEKVS